MGKHEGFVIISILTIIYALAAIVVVAYTTALFIVNGLNMRTELLCNDNCVAQTLAVTEAWFTQAAERGDIFTSEDLMPDAPQAADPVIEAPQDLLIHLRELNPSMSVDVAITDQNYADSYKSMAAADAIPMSSPAVYAIVEEGGHVIEYNGRLVNIRAVARPRLAPQSFSSISATYVVLFSMEKGYSAARLYSKITR